MAFAANSTVPEQDDFSKFDFNDLLYEDLPSMPIYGVSFTASNVSQENQAIKLMKQPQSFESGTSKQQNTAQESSEAIKLNQGSLQVNPSNPPSCFGSLDELFKYLQTNLGQGCNQIQVNGQTLNLQIANSSEGYNQSKDSNLQIINTPTDISDQKVEIEQSSKNQAEDTSAQSQAVNLSSPNTSLTVTQLQAQGFAKLQNINIDFSKIQADFQLENDGLLIIDEIDENNTIRSPSQQVNAKIIETPQADQQIQSQNLQQQQQELKAILTSKSSIKPASKIQKQSGAQHPSSGVSGSGSASDPENQLQLKRHNTEMPLMSHFIVSQDQNRCLNFQPQNLFQTQGQIIQTLKIQLQDKVNEVNKLKDTISRISQSLAKIYSSPQLLQKDLNDNDLLQILSQGFLSQAKIHLAFLFSSPLIKMIKNDESGQVETKTIPQIDYEREFMGVMDSLQSTGNLIKYRKIPATLDNLRITLTECPIALHFSGHGIENNQKNFGKDSLSLKDQGNFLIFEDLQGCAQYMSEKKLHELLEARGLELEFVFVASCYSQFAGEIFHNAGAKHVICVRRGFQISDEASILFSKSFYHALFSQTVTVCQAFDLAKAALRADKNKLLAAESKKFVLLKDTDEKKTLNQTPQSNALAVYPINQKPKKHKCTVFGPFQKGNIENVGQEPLFKLEQSRVEDFIGRGKEMQEIIADIFNNRFVTIKGIPGIGKTTIAKAVIHYLDQRQAFKDGIILLSLRGLDQANMIFTRLQLLFERHIKFNEKDDKSPEQWNIVFQKIISFLKDKEILVCLDNAEDTLRKEGAEFRDILSSFLSNCPRLKFLLTSRYPIGQLADVSEKIYSLRELSSSYAIELLMKKAMRVIDDREIQELLNSKNPSRVLHSNPVAAKKNIRSLDEHHICSLLGGHPHAISLAAPLLQEKSLKELYSLLNSPDIMEWLQIEGLQGTPLASLKVSLNTSVQHMQDQDIKAFNLFCFIGLFPGGCSEDDLNCMAKHGWQKLADKLLRASLLVKKVGQQGEIRYSLFPFMNQYAVQLMDDEIRQEEHKKICFYLAKICKDLLRLAHHDIINKLVQFETNIWACIYRIVDRFALANSEYSTRGKSPAYGVRESHLGASRYDEGLGKSIKEDSSQEDHSIERFMDENNEDYYENFLQSRINDQRSNSHRVVKRSLMNENQRQEENKEDSKSNEPSQIKNANTEALDVACDRASDENKGHTLQNKALELLDDPADLAESQYEDISNNQPQSVSKDSNENKNILDQDLIKTLQLGGQMSDEQITLFLSATKTQKPKCSILKTSVPPLQDFDFQTQVIKTEESIYEHESKSPETEEFEENQEDNEEEDLEVAMIAGDQDNEGEEDSINRSISNEFNNTLNTPASTSQNHNYTNYSNSNNTFNSNSNFTQSFSYLNHSKKNTLNEISFGKLQLLPQNQNFFTNQPTDFNDEANQSVIHRQDDQYDTYSVTSMDSLQGELSSMNMTKHYGNDFYQSSTFLYKRRQSAMSKYHPDQNLGNISETEDEENSMMMEDEDQGDQKRKFKKANTQYEDSNSKGDSEVNGGGSQTLLKTFKDQLELDFNDQSGVSSGDLSQPGLAKKLSSKKYQEDEVGERKNMTQGSLNLNLLRVPEADQQEVLSETNDLNSGQDEKNPEYQNRKSKKSKNKRVTIQENVEVDEKPKKAISRKKGEQQESNNPITLNNMKTSLLVLTPEGALLVYYITNLVILRKYEEALKTVENFGLKYTTDKLSMANLIKIQAFILVQTVQNTTDYKIIQQKYEEASKLFQHLKISHGQALCTCALGFLMYQRPNNFINKKINENMVFDKAMKKLEEAVKLYSKANHYVGEGFCHKILSFIKKKLGENTIDHERKFKAFMQKDSKLRQEGKSTYINLVQCMQHESLFLEVIQQTPLTSSNIREPQIQLKNVAQQKDQTSTSAKRVKKNAEKHIKFQEDSLTQSTNIQNVKKFNSSQVPAILTSGSYVTIGELKNQNKLKEHVLEKKSSTQHDFEFDKLKQELAKQQQESKVSSSSYLQIPDGSSYVAASTHKGSFNAQEDKKQKIQILTQNQMINKQAKGSTMQGGSKQAQLAKAIDAVKTGAKKEEILSDYEALSYNSSQNQKNLAQMILPSAQVNTNQVIDKEERKANIQLQKTKLQIEHFRNTKKTQIEKATKQQQSSFFHLPKNSSINQPQQQIERASFIKNRNNNIQEYQSSINIASTNSAAQQSVTHHQRKNSKQRKGQHQSVAQDLFASVYSTSTNKNADLFVESENKIMNNLAQSELQIYDAVSDAETFKLNESEDEELKSSFRPDVGRTSLLSFQNDSSINQSQSSLFQSQNQLSSNQSAMRRALVYNNQTKTMDINNNALKPTQSAKTKTNESLQIIQQQKKSTLKKPLEEKKTTNRAHHGRESHLERKEEIKQQSPHLAQKRVTQTQQQQINSNQVSQQIHATQLSQSQPQNQQNPQTRPCSRNLANQFEESKGSQNRTSSIPQQIGSTNADQSTQQMPSQLPHTIISQPMQQQVQSIQGQRIDFSVTTTTTVKFEGVLIPSSSLNQIPHVHIDHQPEIIIEQVDDALRLAVSQAIRGQSADNAPQSQSSSSSTNSMSGNMPQN